MVNRKQTVTFEEFKERLKKAARNFGPSGPIYVPVVFNVAPGERRRYVEAHGYFVLQPTTLDWTKLASQLVFPDVWTLRRRLWQEVNTPEDALSFLNQAGMTWWADNRPVVPCDILNVRFFTRHAVTMPPTRWPNVCKQERLPVNLAGDAWSLKNLFPSHKGNRVHLVYLVNSLRQALLSSVLIDALSGRKYRFCRLARCRTPFEVTGQKKKQFCCEEHRQAHAMQRYRARLGKRSIGKSTASKSENGGE